MEMIATSGFVQQASGFRELTELEISQVSGGISWGVVALGAGMIAVAGLTIFLAPAAVAAAVAAGFVEAASAASIVAAYQVGGYAFTIGGAGVVALGVWLPS